MFDLGNIMLKFYVQIFLCWKNTKIAKEKCQIMASQMFLVVFCCPLVDDSGSTQI